jgi:hypothetical protein
MKKLICIMIVACQMSLVAQDNAKKSPWWSAIVSEEQVESAKNNIKLFGIKAALWTARSQEEKQLIAPIKSSGYLTSESCAFFPNDGHDGYGWYACLVKGGLEYQKAKADCSRVKIMHDRSPIASYLNPKETLLTAKRCDVYAQNWVEGR